ncbi:transposase [Paenirhodobacter populi]|uniref:transposase n=1 Tax=Paenirhodobacter populi TaxID=2306993 RepID=UPI00269B7E4F
METALEVLPAGGRGRRNRKWPDEVKARIVAETLEPGATVNEVARRHGLPANHVSSWRTLARKGRLVLPAPEDPVEFATLMLGPGEEPRPVVVRPVAERAELVVGAVTIRLEAGASADRISIGGPRADGWHMIFPSNRVRIMVATKAIDFRKGHDGLTFEPPFFTHGLDAVRCALRWVASIMMVLCAACSAARPTMIRAKTP